MHCVSWGSPSFTLRSTGHGFTPLNQGSVAYKHEGNARKPWHLTLAGCLRESLFGGC
jgi:hypothetical protein